MKVLHLFSNHKITGPAELALETARALRGQGVDASFYSSDVRRTKYRDRWLQLLAEERGLPEPPLAGVQLGKHYSPLRALFDVRRLASYLRETPPDVVHCHLPNDHLLAGYAIRKAGGRIPLVRSLYDGEPPEPTRRTRKTLGGMTARLVCLSAQVADALRTRAADYALDPARVVALPPPIDVERFDPARGVPSRRDALGVPPDAFCVGIVARMQTHRRFELLLEAVQAARESLPDLHVVVVGRGTNQETVARGPVQELGLADRVHFAGYVSGEDYVGTLASFDAKLFLVPGSDGTCRAVREALAMGLPAITSRRGMLPELIKDGETGLLIEETVESMVDAFRQLASDRERARAMGRAAREDAVERFSFARYARELSALYADVC
ncbi:MAG: glycosyltransferase family 4 protein [Planctomycetes bacterium]|nr:glycosyltransferase family 4 protein [Planctomycetota bacterium]